jgi:hypothetical protein
VSWFAACNALVRICGCKLFGDLAHNTRTCHHVVCAQSDLPRNDCKRIFHLRFASVAALRAGTETDAESPALDSAHGSEQLSALALSAGPQPGSQRWLSALALSAWPQREASARVSQRWLSLRGSHDDGTATTTKANNDDDDDIKDNNDDSENDDDDNDDDDDVDKDNDDNDDDHDNNNNDNNNRAAGGGAAARQTVLTTR